MFVRAAALVGILADLNTQSPGQIWKKINEIVLNQVSSVGKPAGVQSYLKRNFYNFCGGFDFLCAEIKAVLEREPERDRGQHQCCDLE